MAIDDKDAEKQLINLRRKIQTIQDELAANKSRRDGISDRLKLAEAAAERARGKISELKAALASASFADSAGIQGRISAYEDSLRQSEAEAVKLNRELEKVNGKISTGEDSLKRTTAQAEDLVQQIRTSRGAVAAMRAAGQKAAETLSGAFNKLGKTLKGIFVASVMLRELAKLKEYISSILASIPEFRAAVADFKGALLTAVYPALERLIPLLITILNISTRVITALGTVVGALFGRTREEVAAGAKALNDQAVAYKNVGSSAKQASKQLASFDTLNIVGQKDVGNSSSATEIQPNFSVGSAMGEEELLGLETLAETALLALGIILTFSGANIPLGLGLIAAGAAGLAQHFPESWGWLKGHLEGEIGWITAGASALMLLIGMLLAFTGAAIGLGIGLILIGAAGLAGSFAADWDYIQTQLQEHALWVAGAGLVLLVLGLVLMFTGAAFGVGLALAIAGAGLIAATVVANWDWIKEQLMAHADWIAGAGLVLLVLGLVLLFTGAAAPLGIGLILVSAALIGTAVGLNWDWIKAQLQEHALWIAGAGLVLLIVGLALLFTGAAAPLGIALALVGAGLLVTTATVNWEWIKGKLQGESGLIVAGIGTALFVLGIVLLFTGVGIPFGIALILAGLAGIIAPIVANWDFILDKLKGVWQGIKDWWTENIAPIFTKDWWAEKFASIKEGLEQKIKDGVNTAIGLINRLIDWINDKAHIEWDALNILGAEVIPAGELTLFKIPRIPELAQGAVIPPNRKFLAVLGDQTSGTNIEAPLDTIVAAFKAAGGGDTATAIMQMGNLILAAIQNQEISAYLDGELVSRQLYSPLQLAARRHGGNLIQGVSG